MKSLIIVRHAKSSWTDASLPDFDRSLNERGIKNSAELPDRLVLKKVQIDFLISSTAKRASQTAKPISKKFKIPEGNFIKKDQLYLAPPDVFYQVIEAIDNKWNHIAIVAHNPGITDFVNELTNQIRVDNVPTCGVFAVTIPEDTTWRNFKNTPKTFWFFDYPKLW